MATFKPKDEESPGFFYIPNYQYIAGPLSELDPNALMREVVTDVNMVVQKGLMFALYGTSGELELPLTHTCQYVGNEFASRGTVTDLESASVYLKSAQAIANELINELQSDFRGMTRQLDYLGCRYVENSPQDLEMIIRLEKPRLEDFADLSVAEESRISNEIRPSLVTVTKLMMGVGQCG